MITCRRLIRLAACAGYLLAFPYVACAVDYPVRPVQMIVGYAAGGSIDAGARLITQELSKRLGQPFLVENHPGASANLAAQEVVRARPDGYTLLACASSNSWNAGLYDNLSFDFTRDIAAVASLHRGGGVMVISSSVPAKTISEFIAYAKANPGTLNMASAGPGTAPGLWGELFKSMVGIDLVAVNYRGWPPALADLIAGRVQVGFEPVIVALGPIKAGNVRALGVTTATRIKQLPDVPAIGEFVPGYEATGWQGICAPKDTPPEIIDVINRTANAALADPVFRTRLTALGAEPFASSPAEFSKFIVEFTDKWRKVIREAGLKPK